jgi:hypothetical protein
VKLSFALHIICKKVSTIQGVALVAGMPPTRIFILRAIAAPTPDAPEDL